MSGIPCFFSKTKSYREKGCQNEATHVVVLGKGLKIFVCDEHVKNYKGVGLKIVELRSVKEAE